MKIKHLYTFTWQNNIYRFCSGNKDTTYNNQIYKATYISHSALIFSNDDNLSKASIYTDKDNPIVKLYEQFITSLRISLSIYALIDNVAKPRYHGIIESVIITNDIEAEIKIGPPIPLDKIANRFTYQSICNHILFDNNCKVDINDFSFFATVTNVSDDGTEVIVDKINKDGVTDPDWLKGGRLIIEANGSASKIDDVSISENKITLLSYFNIKVGDQVRLAAGCNKSRDHCVNKFNNLPNQLAKRYVPGRDPTRGL